MTYSEEMNKIFEIYDFQDMGDTKDNRRMIKISRKDGEGFTIVKIEKFK